MAKLTWIKGVVPEKLPIKQVYGIVFSDDNRVILRIEDGQYKLTGGKPESAETFEETLKREYIEELNVELEDIRYLGYLLIEDDSDKYAQVRMIANIKSIHDIHVDPATGKTYGRELVPMSKVKEYLNYSDSAGNEMIEDAIKLANDIYGGKIYERNMKEKPKVLYHGSKYRFDIVKPHQANGTCETDSKMGIYAVATKDEAVPFALPFRWYPDEPGGKLLFNTDGKKSYLQYGSINPNGKGYIYVLPSDTFELVNEWEWVSSVEVKPIEVIEICVKDYMNTITFSEEANIIQEELYGLSN